MRRSPRISGKACRRGECEDKTLEKLQQSKQKSAVFSCHRPLQPGTARGSSVEEKGNGEGKCSVS